MSSLDPVLEALALAEQAHAGLDGGAEDEALTHAARCILGRVVAHRSALRGSKLAMEARRLLAELEDEFFPHTDRTPDSPTAPSGALPPRKAPEHVAVDKYGAKTEGKDVVLRNGRVGTIVRRFTRNVAGREEVALVLQISKEKKVTVLAREVEVLA